MKKIYGATMLIIFLVTNVSAQQTLEQEAANFGSNVFSQFRGKKIEFDVLVNGAVPREDSKAVAEVYSNVTVHQHQLAVAG